MKLYRKFIPEYRVVPYGNLWRIQYKSLFRWKYYTGKMFFGKPIEYFDRLDAELQVRTMKDQFEAFLHKLENTLKRK